MSTISPSAGSIGIKTDRNNLLTYSITPTSTMSTVTEKINGISVGTKTLTSGQSTQVNLTQEQWDTIKFGRFSDAAGVKNTLTIEMGNEKWNFSFEKQLGTDADILSIFKASVDTNNVSLPASKKGLANAIRSKGGTVSDYASWSEIESAINGIPLGKKFIEVDVSSNASGQLVVTGLSFRPKLIVAYSASRRLYTLYEDYSTETNYVYTISSSSDNSSTASSKTNVAITDTSFNMLVNIVNTPFKCLVFG